MPIRPMENLRAVFYAPYYAAQALGFYAQEGVEIALNISDGPGATLRRTILTTGGYHELEFLANWELGADRTSVRYRSSRSASMKKSSSRLWQIDLRTILSSGNPRSGRSYHPILHALRDPGMWSSVVENRKVAELIVSQQVFERPFAAPPGAPEREPLLVDDEAKLLGRVVLVDKQHRPTVRGFVASRCLGHQTPTTIAEVLVSIRAVLAAVVD